MKTIVALIAAMFATAALAGTAYILPNPAFVVNPNYNNTTTIVTFASVSYRGPSAFVHVGECPKPDSSRYHCDVIHEDNVVLYSPLGAMVTVTLTVEASATLITSGHNYWRQSELVKSGTLVLP